MVGDPIATARHALCVVTVDNLVAPALHALRVVIGGDPIATARPALCVVTVDNLVAPGTHCGHRWGPYCRCKTRIRHH